MNLFYRLSSAIGLVLVLLLLTKVGQVDAACSATKTRTIATFSSDCNASLLADLVTDTVYGVDNHPSNVDTTPENPYNVANEASATSNGRIDLAAGGSLTINSGITLVYGSTFNLGAGASVSLAATAQIKKGAIWVVDVDGDQYRDSLGTGVSQTRPGSLIRLFAVQPGTADSDDGNSGAQ